VIFTSVPASMCLAVKTMIATAATFVNRGKPEGEPIRFCVHRKLIARKRAIFVP
jgi:hypothetical protein